MYSGYVWNFENAASFKCFCLCFLFSTLTICLIDYLLKYTHTHPSTAKNDPILEARSLLVSMLLERQLCTEPVPGHTEESAPAPLLWSRCQRSVISVFVA